MTELQIIPLGGMGNVTQNMFLYVYGQEILIVDCGIGFPDYQMPGVDVLIPDIRFLNQLLDDGKTIVGMVLTHGHDDHIGATPYIIPELPEFPIYASALTAGFAENRMADSKNPRSVEVVRDKEWLEISPHFSVYPIPVTHSVPDTRHYAIKTPEGIIYHGSDFKLDKAPVDGVKTDEEAIEALGKEGILCMLVDCLRVERSEWVESETRTSEALREAFMQTQGKLVVTLMSSHIHRIQQTVDIAVELGRKVVFVGRSVEQNVEVALRLKKLHMPEGCMVDKKEINDFKDSQLCVIIAGSQGQEGSSLMRAVYGEHPVINITQYDRVVFSADAIPGNEIPYFDAIDELSRNGVRVIYPDVSPHIHESGHASAPEQRHLVELGKAKFLFPVGGADRHRVKFMEFVAEPLGYDKKQVLMPLSGDIISFSQGEWKVTQGFTLSARMVDGLGIGDVGPRVLSDRRALGSAGMIVVLIPREKGQLNVKNMQLVSRGFVFMKEAAEVIQFIKETIGQTISQIPLKTKDSELTYKVEKALSRKLYKVIRREPLIVVEIFDR